MSRNQKYKVRLSEEEKEEMQKMRSQGRHSARVLRRVNALLYSADGLSDREVSERVGCRLETVQRLRQRYVEQGLSVAIEEGSRVGAPPKLDAKGEAHLIALACSEAPEGRESWTMQLLADQVIELGIVEDISDETVRRTLKKKS